MLTGTTSRRIFLSPFLVVRGWVLMQAGTIPSCKPPPDAVDNYCLHFANGKRRLWKGRTLALGHLASQEHTGMQPASLETRLRDEWMAWPVCPLTRRGECACDHVCV